jgi:hypothetical protein
MSFPRPSVALAALATPVVGDHPKAILGEQKQLAVPCIRIQRSSVRRREDRVLAPVFVVDRRAIFYRNRAHINFLFVRA